LRERGEREGSGGGEWQDFIRTGDTWRRGRGGSRSALGLLPRNRQVGPPIIYTNYFTLLTLLCGALANDATPSYVASVGTAPHIVSRQARATTYNRMCGALAKGATQKGVASMRREPHKRVGSVKLK
jgi:hypothetical protein